MKNIISKVKKVTAIVLALGMLVVGIAVVPKHATAAVAEDVVIYDESYDLATYWNDGKKAPVKEGYVFGGWFKEATGENQESLTSSDGTSTKICVPLTQDDIDADSDSIVDDGVTAIAKFVPAQVLSVKAQNQSKVTKEYIENLNKNLEQGAEKDYFWVRVMTSLDSKNYAKIGFDIHLANKKAGLTQTDGSPLETNKIYDAVIEDGKVSYAEDIFGDVSDYVCVWQLSKIDTASNAEKIIYVRPYWYTMDGTKVLGLAKYVHIEDEYLNYINVPINLQSAKDIAAGTVSVNCDYTGLQLISDDKAEYFEAGRILPEMDVKRNSESFSMVGNAVNWNEYNSTETIYANIRFQKPAVNENTILNFNMILGEFCDWGEQMVENENVKVWDVSYEIKATDNE